MIRPLSALMLGLNVTTAVAADAVPRLDVERSCRAAASGATSAQRDKEGCLRTEENARAEIGKQWGDFTQRERTDCLRTTTMGGSGSYVEYLTCLEMARDSRKLPDRPLTTGRGR